MKTGRVLQFLHATMVKSSMALALLLATVVYVIAEDITVTTFYPSPRGVYNQLRTMNQTTLAETGGNVGIGMAAPGSRLVVQGAGATNATSSLNVTNNAAASLLFVRDDGNVGIGTVAPTVPLHIVSSASHDVIIESGDAFDGESVIEFNYTVDPNSHWEVGADGNVFEIENMGPATPGQHFVIGNAGNVGIGTAAPAAKLHVVGVSQNTLVLDSPAFPELTLRQGGAIRSYDAIATAAGGYFATSGVGDKIIRAEAGNILLGFQGTEWMRVTPAGNVGIGTAVPGAKLDVVGPGGLTVDLRVNGRMQTGDVGGTGGIWLGNDNSGFVGNQAGNIGFWTNGVGWNALQIVKATGNVGIGTAAPGAKLDVVGGGGVAIDLRVNGRIHSNSAAGGIWVDDATTQFFGLIAPTINGIWNSGWRLAVTNAGNVGIGTLAPDEQLHVAANIHAGGTIRADSDARFKQDLHSLSNVLATLDALTPISYVPSALGVARGQTPAQRQLGVLGQELEQVYPELVGRYGPEAYRAVDYSRLTVVLLEAVKELKAEVSRLQARVDALEERKPR